MLAGYRLLRRLGSGERADVHLAVAAQPTAGSPDEPEPAPALVVVRVYDRSADDDAIATEIHAMEHDPTATVPRLLDVATLPDGRACLVVERIGGRTLATMLDDAHLSPGQVVTALAPLLVAVRELGSRGLVHARLAPSDVLVDEAGRPRLIGLGALERTDARVPASERTERARRAHAALLALMEVVVAASITPTRFEPPIELARSMLLGRPFAPDHEAIERALFAVAEPVPLVIPMGSRAAGPLPSRMPAVIPGTGPVPFESEVGALDGVRSTDPTQHAETGTEAPPVVLSRRSAARCLAELAQLPGIVDGLEGAPDEGVGAAARRRLLDWIRRRPAVLATGGFIGTGALVLVLTAVPPAAAGDGDRAASEAVRGAPATAQAAPTSGPSTQTAIGAADEVVEDAAAVDGTDGSGEVRPGGTEPVEAAAALLEIRAGCLVGRDLACVASYAQPASPIEARDLAAIASGEPAAAGTADLSAISVTSDLGDAVVLSVPAIGEREPASLLMMRSEAGWRLREWFD